MTLLAVAAERGGAVEASVRELDGREVAWFCLGGGPHRGAIGTVEGETMAAVVDLAGDLGIPVVGVLSTSGAEVGEGVGALDAWGRVAAALQRVSGVVPVVLVVDGPCVSGPSLLLGLADVVVMTAAARAWVSGPAAVAEITGEVVDAAVLGGAAVHHARSGVAALLAGDEDEALAAASLVLSYLPPNNHELPPESPTSDPVDRPCTAAATAVPAAPNASYDVRAVVADVVDDGAFVELWRGTGPSVVTGLASVGGRAVGVVANQPCRLAGALDIESSQKAARFVQLCDAFNVALLTLVDTPGFRPGKDIEWLGMIRHGASLVHAYAAATVPRVAVALRKAYGGAYIVMDSKGVGNDCYLAWPGAEMAVMGAAGAVEVLHRKHELTPDARAVLEADYAARYCTPEIAARRGYVDRVIRPDETRAAVASALRALRTKRERLPRRRHANSPL